MCDQSSCEPVSSGCAVLRREQVVGVSGTIFERGGICIGVGKNGRGRGSSHLRRLLGCRSGVDGLERFMLNG